jgi:hypothetical protein
MSSSEGLATVHAEALVNEVLFARECKQIKSTDSEAFRLVYYTTGDVAAKIIDEQKIWLRNTLVVNDFSEIDYGTHCLRSAIEQHRKDFEDVLEDIQTGLFSRVSKWLDELWPTIKEDTYIICVSEHKESENVLGRLSMWRAYGRSNGVAIVIRPRVELLSSNILGAHIVPVSYRTPERFSEEFLSLINGLRQHAVATKSVDGDWLFRQLVQRFRLFILSTKHLGFEEEIEWRIVASPKLWTTKYLERSIEVVGGTPQPVIKIKLQDDQEAGLLGLDLTQLLDRVIVGPCAFPYVVCEALATLLEEKIPGGRDKVFASLIPLRT